MSESETVPKLDQIFPSLSTQRVEAALLDAGVATEPPWADFEPVATAVAPIVVERHSGEPLYKVLPGVRSVGDAPIDETRFRTRSVNRLRRARIHTWETLSRCTPSDILALPNAGQKTVHDIVGVAIVVHLGAALNGGVENDFDPSLDRLIEAFAPLVSWAIEERPDRTIAEVFAELLEEGDQIEPWVALRDLPWKASEVGERAGDDTVAETSALRDLLETISERERNIVLLRKSLEKQTLEKIGAQFDVTRERIRQLERRAIGRLGVAITTAPFAPLRRALGEFRSAVGVAAPLNVPAVSAAYQRLLEALEVDPTDPAMLGLMLDLGGPYQLMGDWLIQDAWDPKKAERTMQRLLARGVVDAAEAADDLAELGVTADVAAELLAHHPDSRSIGDGWWARWVGGVQDKAAIVLSLLLEPTPAETLVELIGEGHTHRSLANQMSVDDRFVRVNRKDWALADWGLAEYEGVAEEIAKLIEANGGSISVDEAVEALSDLAAPLSVRAYCGAPRFVQTDGQVRIRGDEPFELPDDVRRSRGIVLMPSVGRLVAFVPVTADVLRGSGQFVAVATAARLAVTPGEERIWTADDGNSVRLSWTNMNAGQPQLATIRQAAESLAAELGDVMVLGLEFEGDGLRLGLLTTADGVDREELEEAAGCEWQAFEAALRETLGVDGEQVAAALEQRGDSVLARLVASGVVEPVVPA